MAIAGNLAATYASYVTPRQITVHSRGHNAVWAAHRWVGGKHSDADFAALAAKLTHEQITDVFFHVGPLDASGRIDPQKYLHAPEVLTAVKQRAPRVRPQAWIGQIELRGGGPLDLGSQAVRSNIVVTATALLRLGFQGIHYDIEPVHGGDTRYLELLDATRTVTKQTGAALSVATVGLEPVPGASAVVSSFAPAYARWSDGFYRQVINRVDQIAFMSYDSGLPTSWLYGDYVKGQTIRLGGLIDKRTTVFIGAPTYRDSTLLHRPEAENLQSAIRGLQKGLEKMPSASADQFGLAIYADWTTTSADWATYDHDWLGG